jgi:hypothetical protein
VFRMVLSSVATDSRTAAARAFVRSLNILLKFARLYGFDHARTAAQFKTAWNELRAAVPPGSESGLLLGTAGDQLLVDGAPLESVPAERSFAQLLAAAGIASVHFSPRITPTDLSKLARAFPTGNAKSSVLAEQLKTALADATGIRVNEVRFVAEDAGMSETKTAATLTAKALGADAEQFKAWLNDPQKLLQLIAAAQGAHNGSPSGGRGGNALPVGTPGRGPGGGVPPGPPASPQGNPGGAGLARGPREEELLGIFRLLTGLGNTAGPSAEPGIFQQEVEKLGTRAQVMLRDALAALAAQTTSKRPDETLLVRLAEHLAIRFALERFERGEVRVNAVRQMLDRMNQEIDALRKVLSTHEDRLARAGIAVESHAELLDRQFWAAVPESGKRNVLLSAEAWCIPGRNVRQYVEELVKRGDLELAQKILLNYGSCIASGEAEARRRTAIGLGELADLFAASGARLLTEAIRQCGAALTGERDSELQTLISAAFVGLSQEGGTRRLYSAVQQTLASLDGIENQRPAFAQALRPRIGMEHRIPEFIENALRSEGVPAGLAEVMQQMPRPAMEALTQRFSRCGFRDDANRLTDLAQHLGADAVTHLREILRGGPLHEAVDSVALLSRLQPGTVEEYLPPRLEAWPRTAHDRVVRQLAGSVAPERGRLLFELLDLVDPLVMPMVVDEIGMSGDVSGVSRLKRFAAGEVPEVAEQYLRVKAIEALGRLRATEGVPALRAILVERKLLGWAQPEELRIVAAQAMAKIDPDWARGFLPKSGLDLNDLSLAVFDPDPNSPRTRQRRYARARLAQKIPATCETEKALAKLELLALGLGGGMAQTDRHISPGVQGTLRIQSTGWAAKAGWSSLKATVLMRDSRAQVVAFEIVNMDLGDRLKLRRLLLGLPNLTPPENPAAK